MIDHSMLIGSSQIGGDSYQKIFFLQNHIVNVNINASITLSVNYFYEGLMHFFCTIYNYFKAQNSQNIF